jgi:type I restriction enzyme S subunit
MDIDNSMPFNWVKTKLGTICTIVYGKNLPIKELTIEGYPVFGANGIIGFNSKYLYEDRQVLISCRGAYSGKINYSPAKCFITNNSLVVVIIDRNIVITKFLFYGLHIANKSKLVSGTAQPQVTINNAIEIEIPLPPLPEQLRIVAKIEELFSELDKGVEALKTAQQQLKVYRQAVLKWAFEGKQTGNHFREGKLPIGWKLVKIEEVAKTYGGYAFKSGDFKTEGKYQVIRMGNVRPGIIRHNESPVFIDEIDETILSRSLLKQNDVIITQTGTRKKRDYGFTALIPTSNLLLNQRIAAIRFPENYLPKFFLYFSWTDFFKDQFFANETGNVGQGNVGMKAVTESLIPLCPLEEQHQIVQEIETRLSVTDKLEETISQSLQQAEALRQSILKKAFAGKLVPQDPNDEPASKLLERIKAEKSALAPVVKKSKMNRT